MEVSKGLQKAVVVNFVVNIFTTNLLEFFEKVTDAIDKGKPFDCIYLNFAKAFDKVPHFRLIKKLKAV